MPYFLHINITIRDVLTPLEDVNDEYDIEDVNDEYDIEDVNDEYDLEDVNDEYDTRGCQ